MTDDGSAAGGLVALALLAVVLIEFRTVIGLLGIEVDPVRYLLVTGSVLIVLAVLLAWRSGAVDPGPTG